MSERQLERPKESLQNEYQKAHAEGVASAVEYVLKNLERNRRFCERKLLELMPAVEKQLHEAIEARVKKHQFLGESRMLHGYYQEFVVLTKEQESPSSFSEYVKQRFTSEDTDESLERTQLLDRLLKHASTPVYFEYLEGRGHSAGIIGTKFSKEHYRNTIDKDESVYLESVALSERYGRILRQMEEAFEHEIVEE